MDIKNEDLQTFIKIYAAGTFSKASTTLGLTQSALSQKIARLEESLQASVFIRHPRRLELTSSGEKLLLFAKEMTARQEEFLKEFNQFGSELSGVIRIASFSSVMRSIIIPKLTKFMRENKKVKIEFSSHEMFELESILKTNQADFIITDYYPGLSKVEATKIGDEEYVIIQAKKYKQIPEVYIDHGPHDNASETYLKFSGKSTNINRLFMGDVYSIIDGVAAGLGKAVMSKHLVDGDKRFSIKTSTKKYKRPIVLTHIKQNYYGKLFLEVKSLLEK